MKISCAWKNISLELKICTVIKEIKGRWKVNPSMCLVCLTKTVTYLELYHSKRILHGCV